MVNHVSIVNLTDEAIACHMFQGPYAVALPERTTDAELPRGFRPRITLLSLKAKDVDELDIWPTRGYFWKMNRVPESSKWQVHSIKVSKNYYRVVVLPRRHLASFLSDIPDNLRLSALALPGTHDSMALYGWPISQCQNLTATLPVQLTSGIRVLDVRLSVISGKLMSYHGIYPQRRSFVEILDSIHEFLTSPESSRETVVVSIKQEDSALTSSKLFSRLVREEIIAGPGGLQGWFLENRVPTLGEVRGKIVLFSRFGGNGEGWEGGLEGMGIHPTTWPDSRKNGFTWNCKDTLVRTEDWYAIPSFLDIPEKTKLATNILLPPPNNPPVPVLSLSFLSAASFPLATPPLVARGWGYPRWNMGFEGVNDRVGRFLLEHLSSATGGSSWRDEKRHERKGPIRGWVFMDFCLDTGNGVVPLLIECNYRGRSLVKEMW